jgi:hypothetical protein
MHTTTTKLVVLALPSPNGDCLWFKSPVAGTGNQSRSVEEEVRAFDDPNHGARHRSMATMVPSPQHRRIQPLASLQCDKSMSGKLENIIVFTIY